MPPRSSVPGKFFLTKESIPPWLLWDSISECKRWNTKIFPECYSKTWVRGNFRVILLRWWCKLCPMAKRKQLWYELIIDLCISSVVLSLHNALHCSPTHYHPQHLFLVFPLKFPEMLWGIFLPALITAFAAHKYAQPGLSLKYTFCFKTLLFFTCKHIICKTLISFSSHNVFSIFKGNSTSFTCQASASLTFSGCYLHLFPKNTWKSFCPFGNSAWSQAFHT